MLNSPVEDGAVLLSGRADLLSARSWRKSADEIIAFEASWLPMIQVNVPPLVVIYCFSGSARSRYQREYTCRMRPSPIG
jgi:hypothetical protein